MALMGAVREFRRGNSRGMNRYLRGRVVAQGATVAAMLIGSYVYETSTVEKKEQEKRAEKERMMEILNSYPDSRSTHVAPAPEPVPEPKLVRDAKEHLPELTDQPRGVRYTGSNDKWQEFFNRKANPPKAS